MRASEPEYPSSPAPQIKDYTWVLLGGTITLVVLIPISLFMVILIVKYPIAKARGFAGP